MSPTDRRDAPPSDSSAATLFLPQSKAAKSRRWSLSPHLQRQISRRLRLIALTYSLAFLFADLVPSLAFGEFAYRFHNPFQWAPTFGSIFLGLAVAAFARSDRLGWQGTVNLGLAFEVVGSIGISMAQYVFSGEEGTALRSEPHLLMSLSPSWVAVWMMFYSIIVPAPPRKALAALIASGLTPLVVMWTSLHAAHIGDLMSFPSFLVHHALPYAIVVAMTYAGVRVIYNLGEDVSRAQELGSYRLIERLGSGGMGEVWRASHHLLARSAAIKFIRPEAIAGIAAGEAKLLLKRFELEAQSTASLTSAHTVEIFDFGVTDDGRFYYVMELLDGLDCDNLVRRFGAVSPARVVHLVLQMCDSLDEAHARGLIHRDVKPANIYVCRNGNRFDFVKVLDFGLVAQRGAPAEDDMKLTQPNQAVGTPQFMPPEVALGKEMDGRTDLYSLGCVAYWLASGRPVFTGENMVELLSKHLRDRPDPPSRHAPNAVPAELDAAILACLEKDPEKRPRTARELAQRLRAIPLADRWGDDEAQAWWEQAGLAGRGPAGSRPEASQV